MIFHEKFERFDTVTHLDKSQFVTLFVHPGGSNGGHNKSKISHPVNDVAASLYVQIVFHEKFNDVTHSIGYNNFLTSCRVL